MRIPSTVAVVAVACLATSAPAAAQNPDRPRSKVARPRPREQRAGVEVQAAQQKGETDMKVAEVKLREAEVNNPW